jgi:hypothetical protein
LRASARGPVGPHDVVRCRSPFCPGRAVQARRGEARRRPHTIPVFSPLYGR